MRMNSTVSLSKGVFAFRKPKDINTNSKKLTYQHWKQDEMCINIRKLTSENYEKCQLLTNQVVETLYNETHEKVFEDMIIYLEKVGYNKCQAIFDNSSSLTKDIPAACLVTGVNMPDHSTLFDNLTKTIREKISPHVARLTSSTLTNIKSAMFKLVHSLVNKDDNDDGIYMSDSDEEEIFVSVKSPKKKKSLKKHQCHMASLATWYKEHCENQVANKHFSPSKSPSKRRRKSSNKDLRYNSHQELKESGIAPIIVIIEEVESIPIEVLQDLILISSEYQRSIPLVFVFGVSTTPSYIHRHLSQEASSFITMETFQAQPSSLLLSEVIDKVLMSFCVPFRLGGKVFKLLLDIFLFHDLSVQNFISSLKYCMLEHFVRGEASFLCCSRVDREKVLKNISSKSITALRNISSFKKLEETLSEEEIKKLKDDSYFTKRVQNYLCELEDWYTTFCTLVKVLHCLVSGMPGTPLGRQVRELLALCLSQQVAESEEFQSAWKLVSMSSKIELISKLDEVRNILDASDKNDDLKGLSEKLKIYSRRLTDEEKVKEEEEEKPKSPSRIIELKPSDRFYLREKLLGHQSSKYPKSAFEELRKEILTCFEHAFISHLKPFHGKPFHEVFFFDAIGTVKYQLLGSVRATVQTGLTDPHKYLQCECCKLSDKDLLVTSLPDVSLCYKLHLECGRFINLYDWLQAFIAVVSGEEEAVNKKKKKVDEKLQARFIQSVAELQLLGFIKPTKRKTDHVQRLTWGGC